MQNVELVKTFLKAQNLEQLGRIDDSIELYELTIAEKFDSSGPYDRLIALYSNQARHQDVERVTEAAIANVHTHEQKKEWYEQMRDAAVKANEAVPRAAPKQRP